MATDSVARRVAQKELRLFFASPVAWLFLAAFAATTLFVFFWVESFFARNIADLRPLFEWMPLLLKGMSRCHWILCLYLQAFLHKKYGTF